MGGATERGGSESKGAGSSLEGRLTRLRDRESLCETESCTEGRAASTSPGVVGEFSPRGLRRRSGRARFETGVTRRFCSVYRGGCACDLALPASAETPTARSPAASRSYGGLQFPLYYGTRACNSNRCQHTHHSSNLPNLAPPAGQPVQPYTRLPTNLYPPRLRCPEDRRTLPLVGPTASRAPAAGGLPRSRTTVDRSALFALSALAPPAPAKQDSTRRLERHWRRASVRTCPGERCLSTCRILDTSSRLLSAPPLQQQPDDTGSARSTSN